MRKGPGEGTADFAESADVEAFVQMPHLASWVSVSSASICFIRGCHFRIYPQLPVSQRNMSCFESPLLLQPLGPEGDGEREDQITDGDREIRFEGGRSHGTRLAGREAEFRDAEH
jgi:hypothetical protein